MKNKDIEENHVLAALSYIPGISIIALLIRKDSKFVVFHAKQAIIILVLGALIAWIPFYLATGPIEIVFLVVLVVGFVKALQKEWYKIPLIGDIAEKINI